MFWLRSGICSLTYEGLGLDLIKGNSQTKTKGGLASITVCLVFLNFFVEGKLPIVPMNALDNSIPERMEEILTRLFQEYFEGLQIAFKL